MEQPVGSHGGGHIRAFDGKADVVKPVFFQQGCVPQSAFHQCLGGDATILGLQILFQGAAIDADADGDMPVPTGLGHRFHLLLPADVAGVDADGVDALLRTAESIAVVEMNVCYQGDMDTLLDGAHRIGGSLVGNSHPDDLAPGLLQLEDLGHSGLHIVGLGIAHGLDGHRGTTAHRHSTHKDLFCHTLTYRISLEISVKVTTSIRPISSKKPAVWT